MAESETGSGRPHSPVRLVIADVEDLARAGLRGVLGAEPDLEIVGEASSEGELLALCRRHRPDVVLVAAAPSSLDWQMVACGVRRWCPQAKLLVSALSWSEAQINHALGAGAHGVLLKDAPRWEIVAAVRRALQGEPPLLPALLGPEPPAAPGSPGVERLTAREHEVLELLARGLTNAAIARRLGIRPGTVKVHVEHIIGKLGAADRTQAVVRAVELGILDVSGGDAPPEPPCGGWYYRTGVP